MKKTVLTALLAQLALAAFAVCAQQNYPARPIRLIVPYPPGGNVDITARIIGPVLGEIVGQSIVIDNRSGAGGNLGANLVAKAPPDGYTLLMGSSAPLAINPIVIKDTPYDPLTAFAPVSRVHVVPLVVLAGPKSGITSVRELIERAKAAPGEINYASGPVGAANHLAAELFNALAGVKLVRIGYKGGGPAINDVLAGQVKVMFATAGSVSGHVKAGRLKGLAVTSAQPSPLVPGLPTVAASGVPGYEAEAIYGFWAPAGTPAATVTLLNREAVAVLKAPEVTQRFFNAGIETVGTTSREFAAIISSEAARLDAVIRKAGLRGQQ